MARTARLTVRLAVTWLIGLGLLAVHGLAARQAAAAPGLGRPGYTLAKVSIGVPAIGISQLAFRPGDPAHVYAARTSGVITRYDYDAAAGRMSNALDVAAAPGYAVHGLAFHGSDLYASLNAPPAGGRLARFSDPDASGVYRIRHDFVHSIPTRTHGVNQIQIVGATLYVGIGAAGRKGDPAEENVYTMTVARIVDLGQVDFSGPIGPDFTGPTNYLADPVEWVNTAGAGGRLRYYASGFRNPFGIAVDADGGLWLSTNGNSDPGFLSPDLVYRKVPLGGRGDFPPASFGFGPPHVTGIPIEPLANLGQSPSPTGLAFMPSGPDTGKLVVAEYGANNDPAIGRDVVLVDPVTGAPELLITDLKGPTDVVQDPFGRLLVADYEDSSVWLLVHSGGPDITPPVPGAVSALNARYGNWVDSPLDLSTSFRDSESAVTACDYTVDGGVTWRPAVVTGAMPNFTCIATGITGSNGQVLRLNMRATSDGGTAQGAVLSVTVDALAPAGSVTINANAPSTRATTVTLTLAATDASGVAGMCISNVSSCSAWEPFARTRTWSLAPGDGVKTVYAWFRDRVGNSTASPAQDQITLDATPPANPTTVTSSSHAVGTWSADRTIDVRWAGATDGGSGVSGYSLRWDRAASTIPDAVADTTAVMATSPSLPDGNNHFVHLRTVDKAGNWAVTAVHLGPFLVDGTPPVNGILTATSGNARVSLSWSRFSDATSGLPVTNTYQLVYSTSAYPATWCANGTPVLVGAAAQFEHQNLVPGARYYYRLCAFDKAGNVSTGAIATAIPR
jgi:glucose/arabinose dehydrogenase